MEVKDFFTNKKNKLGNKINLYVCGPTVYDEPHIGNMRPIVIFDIFNKVASLNGDVNFTHNITDIDDKIIAKAIKENKSEKEISKKYTKKYLNLLSNLNITTPTHMPKVSENVPGMIKFIDSLVDKGFAYEAKGSVYFNIKFDKNYGKIVNLNIKELLFHEKDILEKRNPHDFALWKKTEEGISFTSPWSKGRPGWHTECAYFIKKIYGNNGIDVHGGGIDLKFPHHINEMSQYHAETGNELAKTWMYVGHVQIDDEKMSKSLNNFWGANKFINQYSANILRVILSSIKYTKPININENLINNAKDTISKIRNSIKTFIISKKILEPIKDSTMIDILSNDLDTSAGFTYLFELLKKVNDGNEEAFQKLLFNLEILGIKADIDENKLNAYKEAHNENNYELSDKLRKEIVIL